MIDFAKLRSRTPEQRDAAAAEADLAYRTRSCETIAERRRKILGLISVMESLTSWEQAFVSDMEKRSREEGFSGLEHEALLDLSDNQVSMLEKIYSERVKPETSEPLPEDMAGSAP